MVDLKPWDKHRDLTNERLVRVESVLVDVREDALLSHEPEKGDGLWGYGCRAHERQIDAIKKLAGEVDWLTVLEDGRHFVFMIGKVPVRFYKGSANRPKPNSLQQRVPEINAQQQAFSFAQNQKWLWRFAIETEATGKVSRIVVVAVSIAKKHGKEHLIDTHVRWEVPLAMPVRSIANLSSIQLPGKQLDKPVVRAKSRTKKNGTNDGGA